MGKPLSIGGSCLQPVFVTYWFPGRWGPSLADAGGQISLGSAGGNCASNWPTIPVQHRQASLVIPVYFMSLSARFHGGLSAVFNFSATLGHVRGFVKGSRPGARPDRPVIHPVWADVRLAGVHAVAEGPV